MLGSDHLDPCYSFVLFRVRELIAAKMIVEKFLLFTFFSSSTAWTEMVGVLTSGNTAFPALPARRVKQLIVEMYCYDERTEFILVREGFSSRTRNLF